MAQDRILITIRGKQAYMKKESLAKEFEVTTRTIDNRLKEFREEIEKGRYPAGVIIDGPRINFFAFSDYLTYRGRLLDKNLRKTVPEYDPTVYMKLAGIKQEIIELTK